MYDPFSYNGVYKYIDISASFVYDGVGNSQNGRQLAGISKDGLTTSYAYNDSGIRLRKTVNGVTTQYYLNGSLILSEITGDVQTDYYYDESGNVFGFKRGNSEYYYIRNGQGDIIGILDSSGTQIVSYVYDSWGKLVSVTDASGNDKSGDASFIGNLNPFRYRSYYYDTETGLYYLQSRYYDPEVGRFLNIDSVMGVNGDIHTYNLFAYCGNNPVCRADSGGQSWWSVFVAAAAVFAVCVVTFVAAPVVAPVVGVAATSVATTAFTVGTVAAVVGIGALVLATAENTFGPIGDWGSIDGDKLMRSVIDDIKGKLGKFGLGGCILAAEFMKEELLKRGEHGEIVTLTWPIAIERAGRGVTGCYVVCISKHDQVVGSTGIHMGVLYDDMIYCNIHPNGMPEYEWINDFDSWGPKIVTRTKF